MYRHLQHIREQLGLSQRAMALQMGISRSMLSMVELGERQLPLAALKKLALMEQRLPEVDALTLPTALHTFVQKQLQDCEYHLLRLQRLLEEQKRKYEQLNRGLQLLRQEGLPANDGQRIKMQRALKKVDALAQMATQLQLAAWGGKKEYLLGLK